MHLHLRDYPILFLLLVGHVLNVYAELVLKRDVLPDVSLQLLDHFLVLNGNQRAGCGASPPSGRIFGLRLHRSAAFFMPARELGLSYVGCVFFVKVLTLVEITRLTFLNHYGVGRRLSYQDVTLSIAVLVKSVHDGVRIDKLLLPLMSLRCPSCNLRLVDFLCSHHLMIIRFRLINPGRSRWYFNM